MRTLQECKDEVAIEHGYGNWNCVNEDNEGIYLEEIAKLYAKEVATQALIDASERVLNSFNEFGESSGTTDTILNTEIKLL